MPGVRAGGRAELHRAGAPSRGRRGVLDRPGPAGERRDLVGNHVPERIFLGEDEHAVPGAGADRGSGDQFFRRRRGERADRPCPPSAPTQFDHHRAIAVAFIGRVDAGREAFFVGGAGHRAGQEPAPRDPTDRHRHGHGRPGSLLERPHEIAAPTDTAARFFGSSFFAPFPDAHGVAARRRR